MLIQANESRPDVSANVSAPQRQASVAVKSGAGDAPSMFPPSRPAAGIVLSPLPASTQQSAAVTSAYKAPPSRSASATTAQRTQSVRQPAASDSTATDYRSPRDPAQSPTSHGHTAASARPKTAAPVNTSDSNGQLDMHIPVSSNNGSDSPRVSLVVFINVIV